MVAAIVCCPGYARGGFRSLRSRRSVGRADRRAVRASAEARRGRRGRGVQDLPRGRASRHTTRHGAVARNLPGRGGATHAPDQVRAARLPLAPLHAAAAHRRNCDARPDERRALRARSRPRDLALRARVLRRGFSRGARDVRRGARRDPGGTLRGALDPSWAVLPISRRPDRAHAGPATASAALAGRDLTGGRGRGRRARRQHRRDRAERSDERGRRALLRGVEQEIGREGADGGHPAPRVRGRDRRRGDRRRARGLPGLVRQPDEPLASVQHGARPVRRDARARAHHRRGDRRLAGDGARRSRTPPGGHRLQLFRGPLHVRESVVRAGEPLAGLVEHRSHAEVP